MKGVLAHALARLAHRRGRALLAGAGIAAAAAMLGAALTVAFSLATGFDRAASRANLPDAIAQFGDVPAADVLARARGLPNVRAAAVRLQRWGAHVAFGAQENDHATAIGVAAGPRGYAVVAGRDVGAAGNEVVVERGLARTWHVHPGDMLTLGISWDRPAAPLHVVGVAVSPETVAFPLASGPRVYLPYDELRSLAAIRDEPANTLLLWTQNRSHLDVTLAQARASSFGLTGLTVVTRKGLRLTIAQAAGIVIALLVAFSLVALAAAGVMLAAAAAAEVQRRREAIGVLRALGASPRQIVQGYALEAAVVGLVAGGAGLAAGWLAVAGETARLLSALNELMPGPSVVLVLAAALAAIVAVLAAFSAWPAWRAASRPPVESLRGADVAAVARRLPLPAGAAGLGLRLVLARPVRAAAAVVVLAASAAVVLLILTIASLLQRLQTEPQAVGKRYQLSVAAPAAELPRIRALPGVRAAAARYETDATDSYNLGESFRVIAFGADHTSFEAPPLAAGRRLRSGREVEVGVGLADALNLHPGSTLAAQLTGGRESRFRVVGIVRALADEGRVAYVPSRPLLAAEPWLEPTIAVRVSPGRAAAVRERLAALGLYASDAGGVAGEAVQGWAARNSGFVSALVALLRSVAVIDGLVCLYALAQMLALAARERRRAVSIVRACGAGPREVRTVFAAAALAVAALAAPAGIALQRRLVAPAVSHLAASYVVLPLAAGPVVSAIVVGGLLAAALAAAALVARNALREPALAALREE